MNNMLLFLINKMEKERNMKVKKVCYKSSNPTLSLRYDDGSITKHPNPSYKVISVLTSWK